MNKSKNNLKKFFIIPVIVWIILGILTIMAEQSSNSNDALSWSDFILTTIIICIPWTSIYILLKKIINKKHYQNNTQKNLIQKPSYKDISKNLYIQECVICIDDYKKIIDHFPSIYTKGFIVSIIPHIIFIMILFLIFNEIIICLFYFIVAMVFMLLSYKKSFNKYIEKKYATNYQNNNLKYTIKFYNDYIVKVNKKDDEIIYYKDISKNIKTTQNILLKYSSDKILILPLDSIENNTELKTFLNNKLNIEAENTNQIAKKKLEKIILNILFISSLISIFGALKSYDYYCENVNKLIYSASKNLWIFWLWLPLPILSIIYGYKKCNNKKSNRNIITGYIISILLLVIGCLSFTESFEVPYEKINQYKEYIGINMPENGKMEIINWTNWNNKNIKEYKTIIVYFENDDINQVTKEIVNNINWIKRSDLPASLNEYVELDIYSNEEVYYTIYNQTIDKYNKIPEQEGLYKIYVIKYITSEGYMEIKEYMYNH